MRRVLAGLILFVAADAQAQTLPKDLLLQCEGTVSVTLHGVKPSTRKRVFKNTKYRLKDGIVVDPIKKNVWGEDCVLRDGNEILCESTRNRVHNKGMTKTVRSRASIKRDTGEMNFYYEVREFKNGKPTGRFGAHSEVSRIGRCVES